ncbi:MAG: GNAT family N-acetyltransferase [Fermentimonas sp.]|jgi:hypothetical protein
MIVRASNIADIDKLMDIYAYARQFMKRTGNPNQWHDDYPSKELIYSEIVSNHSFVVEDDEGEIVGTFCFIKGEDPTYINIFGGNWLNDNPYGVIHRIASNGRRKGVAKVCFDWCFAQINDVRIDTHRDNKVMQGIVTTSGFHYCGIIYLANGAERLAYHKSLI